MPHIIRLRGPWEYKPLWVWEQAPDGSRSVSNRLPPPGGSFIAPGNWRELLGDDFRGFVRLVRLFHRPTGLNADSRVWLAYYDMPSAAPGFILNGCPCGREGSSSRDEITRLLQSSNELWLSVTLDGQDPPALLGQVQLEIE
jgi:hypothetical protein